MKSRGIVNLPVSRLIPHPENPRKDLGDLTEMTESIKKNGVLQNLTVIPKSKDKVTDADANTADYYMVIIGHRRMAAAKAAGVDYVPCRIVEGMTHEEQLLTMLEENMQRQDLTIYDQAQGFQMMLDLGQTIEDIEAKSGFSKTTIYHRLNIAKLDKDTLKKKQEDIAFQLSITDLIELEKVKDVEKRNEILKKARNSSELKYLSSQQAKEAERQENFEKIARYLDALGVEPLPDEIKSWNCDRLYTIPLDDFDPDLLEDITEGEELYYSRGWDSVCVYTPRQQEEGGNNKQELHQKVLETRDALRSAIYGMNDLKKQALEEIALGNLKATNEETATKALWQAVMCLGTSVDIEEMARIWLNLKGIDVDNMEDPEEAEDAYKETETFVFELSMARQFALLLSDSYIQGPINEANGQPSERAVENIKVLDIALRNYGFVTTKEDESLLDGSSPLVQEYAKAKAEYEA